MLKKHLITGLALMIVIGCAEEKKKATPANPKTVNTSSDATTIPTSGDSLCTNLKANRIAQSLTFGDFVTELCTGSLLSELRSSVYAYADANSQPNPKITSSPSGARSNMRLWASLKPNTDALSYYNFMRLQISKPIEFTPANGFEQDKFVTYTVNSSAADSVNYKYLNNKEDEVVEYVANTYFSAAIPGQLYLVSSQMDTSKSSSTIKSFRGLQIIAKSADGKVEVFSVADQVYDNNGDHNFLVGKATKAFKEDMTRGLRNSANASQANKFFPQ